MNSCGNCRNMNRGDPEIARPGVGFCYADISDEDVGRVAAVLPAACLLYGVTWRSQVKDADGQRCPKWRAAGPAVSPLMLDVIREPERIDQTVLGPKGNCHSACLAMLLGLRLEHVPNFNDAADYHGALHAFLRELGYTLLTFPISSTELRAFQKGYAIVGGRSPRGYNHAVLYHDGELWHDPHPERGGVEVSAMDVVYPLRPFETKR